MSKLLLLTPAICTCLTIVIAILHYFHILNNVTGVLVLLGITCVVNVLSYFVISIKTKGNLPYILLGNMMFFIVFVFSATTVQSHNCEHHEEAVVFQYGVHDAGEEIKIGVGATCVNCSK
ncbi:hypothetical protein EKG38_04075 [Shewanella canadensis]|uniref:Uncharacterized protein n=1 Tax=Shewanella canadensis TaxID=271096 RepID=A0A3S0IPL4_9GAMM|nr:hypothetical protein [Shewanella canadensis]RTR39943.1 hypothetical protein EKG38_04075 [Shewanella canadensis]